MRAYHGGAPGLRPGDWITPRPPGDTAHLHDGCPTCEARRRGERVPGDDLDRSLVYVTWDRNYARLFANGYPDGALYRVETHDAPLTPSPDPETTGSFGVPRAQVVAVLDALVRMRPAEVRRAASRYATAIPR